MELFHMTGKKNGHAFAILKLDQENYLDWLESCYWEKVQSQTEANFTVSQSQPPPVIVTLFSLMVYFLSLEGHGSCRKDSKSTIRLGIYFLSHRFAQEVSSVLFRVDSFKWYLISSYKLLCSKIPNHDAYANEIQVTVLQSLLTGWIAFSLIGSRKIVK